MNKKSFLNDKKIKDVIFCLLVLLIPMVQFAIFYVTVNLKSLSMAFQSADFDEEGRIVYTFYSFPHLFDNFKEMFDSFSSTAPGYGLKTLMQHAPWNSLLVFFFVTGVGISLSLIFSLYIFKKYPGASFFRALLFMPSILSAIVTVTMFKQTVENAIPAILGLSEGLYANPNTRFATIIFYNVWIGFGTQILMYSGAMNGIDPSITEAAKLDGANPFVEFFCIILPLIFPTIQTFIVTGLAGLFVNQANIVAFDALDAGPKYNTIGYYLFAEAQKASTNNQARFPMLATYGISLTAIAVPLTLFARWAMDKFGPSIE